MTKEQKKERNKEYYKRHKEKINEMNNTNHWVNRDWHNLMNLANRWTKDGRGKWINLQERYNEQNPTIRIQWGPAGNRKTLQVRAKSKKLRSYLKLVKRKDWEGVEKLKSLKV